MGKNESDTISFLKEVDKEVETIFSHAKSIAFIAEGLYESFEEWLEQNFDVSHLESFKSLEKDIRGLFQSCRFLPNDCLDVRHSINDCGVELN